MSTPSAGMRVPAGSLHTSRPDLRKPLATAISGAPIHNQEVPDEASLQALTRELIDWPTTGIA